MLPKEESSTLITKTFHRPPVVKQKAHYDSWMNWVFLDSWTIEYLGMALAIISLAAIVATLGVYNGLPLQTWRHSIRLNTVLSTLATLGAPERVSGQVAFAFVAFLMRIIKPPNVRRDDVVALSREFLFERYLS
jgi:hypothetical protein